MSQKRVVNLCLYVCDRYGNILADGKHFRIVTERRLIKNIVKSFEGFIGQAAKLARLSEL